MNKETESELIRNLTGQIESELQDGTAIWGHGTLSREQADNILAEGILANPAYGLSEIAFPITDSTITKGENANHIVEQALNWPHKDAKFLVLVNFPPGITSMMKLKEFVNINGHERTHIPTRFLRGYIDAMNLSFVKNPNFQKDAPPTDLSIPAASPAGRKTFTKVTIPKPSETGSADDVW